MSLPAVGETTPKTQERIEVKSSQSPNPHITNCPVTLTANPIFELDED